MADDTAHIPTTVDLLEMARSLMEKEKNGGERLINYRMAKLLGWSPSRLGNYFAGRSTLDEDGCETIAEVIGWPLETVLACVYLERAKKQNNDAVTKAWERLCQRVAITVTPIFIGFLAGIASPF